MSVLSMDTVLKINSTLNERQGGASFQKPKRISFSSFFMHCLKLATKYQAFKKTPEMLSQIEHFNDIYFYWQPTSNKAS